SNAELASLTSGLTAGSSLMVGQKINVPLQEVEELTASSQKTEQKFENVKVDQTATENYQVKRGETLYTIASQSKLSVSE
ncbi:LysM peptidoglycan-binding domain-containing protein, partial [Neisseria gonorrhoeae]